MRQVRQQRIGSYHHHDKENDFGNTNLPSLKNPPHARNYAKPEYHLNLKDGKKTFLNLYSKKEKDMKLNLKKENIQSINSIETTRLGSQHLNTLSSEISGTFMSSRGRLRPEICGKIYCSNERKIGKIGKRNGEQKILRNHKITSQMRAKMIDWLLEITEAYRCSLETFFLSIYLMDMYMRNCERSLGVSELHEIGVTCIFMACKYEQIHPITLKTVYRDIGHGKISKSDIIGRQSDILKAINFEFGRDCAYLVCRELLHNFLNNFPENLYQRVVFFLKLATFNSEIMRTNSGVHLAKGAILAAVRTTQTEISSNLDVYDNFTSICGRDYEKSHIISGSLMLLQANFREEFGSLENMEKIWVNSKQHRGMIQSCAL